MPLPEENELLTRLLRDWLGDIDDPTLALLHERLAWVTVGAGGTLLCEGEPGDAMYLAVSGRLRAYVTGPDGQPRRVREMGRGQVIGEMALFTREPRSATVVAVRDSLLVRLAEPDFRALLAASPAFALAVTRQTVQRLREGPLHAAQERPVALALVPVSTGVDAPAFAQALAAALAAHGRVAVVDAARVDAALGAPGIARHDEADADAGRRVALWLDAEEAAHDCLLLVADVEASAWTARCCRRADELLLLADATQPPALHDSERRFLVQRPGRAEAAECLLLLHPADAAGPRGTAAWLARRPVSQHLHLRHGHAGDLRRLARVLARQAVGLVLAGGGARGFAHLGVLQALQARGIEVDFVGGTSMGAVMSVLAASGRPVPDLLALARRMFARNPTGDFNLLPMLSLIRGRRLRQAIEQGVQALMGHDGHAEDLWLPWFCVATNFSQARQQVIAHGPLARALRASTAIPGALPPVLHDGDLLCDGGSFNNFPVDVMRAQPGVGFVIGVDLAVPNRRRIPGDEVPSPWALLADRLRHPRRRRHRFPGLVGYLMGVSILYSASRQPEARRQTDLYLAPPLPRVGLLQWNRLDAIAEQGREYAEGALATLAPALAAQLSAASRPASPASTS